VKLPVFDRTLIRETAHAAATVLIVLAVCVVVYLTALACYVITSYATDVKPTKTPTPTTKR
jgi:hypothetical protein